MRGLFKTGLLAGFAYGAWRLLTAKVPEDDDRGAVGSSGVVRDAGHAAQSGVAETDWDTVDQQSDESFPASDPPGNY